MLSMEIFKRIIHLPIIDIIITDSRNNNEDKCFKEAKFAPFFQISQFVIVFNNNTHKYKQENQKLLNNIDRNLL